MGRFGYVNEETPVADRELDALRGLWLLVTAGGSAGLAAGPALATKPLSAATTSLPSGLVFPEEGEEWLLGRVLPGRSPEALGLLTTEGSADGHER